MTVIGDPTYTHFFSKNKLDKPHKKLSRPFKQNCDYMEDRVTKMSTLLNIWRPLYLEDELA